MDKKVILISIDGMRPDGLKACGNQFVKELERRCLYTYNARTLYPSSTFPCHYSMTHSVPPERHGMTTNAYVPPVRPVAGLFEKIRKVGGACAMLYGWEILRDIATPGALRYSCYIHMDMTPSTDTALTDEAIGIIDKRNPDFVFLYLGDTDDKGHSKGWMSEEYLRRISIAIDNVKRIFELYSDRYSIIIMSDHGGHDRLHGTDLPEDMIIPLFFYGKDYGTGETDKSLTLLDIAPTIVKTMGIEPDPEWEGTAIF